MTGKARGKEEERRVLQSDAVCAMQFFSVLSLAEV